MSSGKVVALLVSVLLLLVAAPRIECAITCTVVYGSLTPCLNYLNNGGTVPPACCNGVSNLVAEAQSVDDRREVCNCLKQIAARASSVVVNRAAAIPSMCNIPIPYVISPTIDCSKVN